MVADHPHQAKWLSVREKDWIESQLAADLVNNPYIAGKKSSFGEILSNINIWKLIGIYFFMQVGFYGFSLWMPSLIKEITHSGMGRVGMLSIFPYILTIVGQYWFAKRCDATMNRRLYTALPFIGFALCLFLSILLQQNMWMSYGMMVVCGFFLQAYAGPFWTLPALLFPHNVVGGVRGSINALGNLGGFIGPYMVGALTTNVGQSTALYTLVGSLLIAAALTFTLPAITANGSTESQVVKNVMAER
jgi:nitrate/nitrite transporter NarK